MYNHVLEKRARNGLGPDSWSWVEVSHDSNEKNLTNIGRDAYEDTGVLRLQDRATMWASGTHGDLRPNHEQVLRSILAGLTAPPSSKEALSQYQIIQLIERTLGE